MNMIVNNIIGLCLFYIIFVILIPFLLYKKEYYIFLEAYLPNVELIANLLTWIGGPMNIWSNLYSGGNDITNKVSQIMINYTALLGLTFIVAREAVKTKSIAETCLFL